MSVNNRIKELRKKAGIAQEELGAEIGCNKSKISKLENGKQELTQNWMIKIAAALTKFGLPTKPSDLLPSDHVYYSKKEQDIVETLRTLKEPQRREFEAMVSILKSKNDT